MNAKEPKYFFELTPQELETKIKETPITETILWYEIFAETKTKIRLRKYENEDFRNSGLVIPHYSNSDRSFICTILINTKKDENSQYLSFAHELVHIFYRCNNTKEEEKKKIETIIEREAQRLITEFPIIIKTLYQNFPSTL